MRCNWWRWLWGIVPLLVLGWVAVQAEHGRIEADLRARAAQALAQAGMGWAATQFAGRDAILEGKAGDETEPLKAAEALRGVWGVRVVDNNAELLPKVDNYTWAAARKAQRIYLVGYVPTKAARQAILGVTKANFPGFEVHDRMATARGVPALDTWLGGVSFALKQLAALKKGDVHLDGLGLSVKGESEDVASYRAVKSALANALPKGIKLTADQVTAPEVSPFTWSAQFADGRLVLAGYVPSETVRTELLAAAKAGFTSMIILDTMQPAEGAPPGWAGAAVAGVRQLARLESGGVEMKDAGMVVSGLAGDAATARAVRAALRGAMPTTIALTDQIKAREPPPPPPPPAPAPPASVVPPPVAKEVEQAAPPKAETSMAPPAAPAQQIASAAEIAAKACEDSLTRAARAGQIVFGLASADLDNASFITLDRLAEAAKACPDMKIEVDGHASAEGGAEINQQLSVRRAQSVVAYLVKAGVESTQLHAVGYGATRPIAPNDSADNMARNRRIEFTVRPK